MTAIPASHHHPLWKYCYAIHITIRCISCNHHNFAARLFIPLGKRDGVCTQPTCAHNQQFLMRTFKVAHFCCKADAEAIWLRSQESGRNNNVFAVETFFFLRLFDQDTSDKHFFIILFRVLFNYVLNKTIKSADIKLLDVHCDSWKED